MTKGCELGGGSGEGAVISATDLRLIQHRSGRYLAFGYSLDHPTCGGGRVYRLTLDLMDACRGEARFTPASYLGHGEGWDPDLFSLVPSPVCACCGMWRLVRHRNGCWSPYRCEKHADRNPCAIDGCARTRAAQRHENGDPWLANHHVLCGEHWRRYVPPRSRARRAYHAFFRRAKRQGDWDDKLERRFWRFWDALVRTARRRATEGCLDEAVINKMFGWAE